VLDAEEHAGDGLVDLLGHLERAHRFVEGACGDGFVVGLDPEAADLLVSFPTPTVTPGTKNSCPGTVSSWRSTKISSSITGVSTDPVTVNGSVSMTQVVVVSWIGPLASIVAPTWWSSAAATGTREKPARRSPATKSEVRFIPCSTSPPSPREVQAPGAGPVFDTKVSSPHNKGSALAVEDATCRGLTAVLSRND